MAIVVSQSNSNQPISPEQKQQMIRLIELIKAKVDAQGGYWDFPLYVEFCTKYLSLDDIPI